MDIFKTNLFWGNYLLKDSHHNGGTQSGPQIVHNSYSPEHDM